MIETNKTEEVLQQITAFADQCHGEQTRKYTPERYIVHPVRVMRMCQDYTDDLAVLAAALLHDVLEDTPVRKEALHGFLIKVMSEEDAAKTVSLVEELTDVYVKDRYPKWNRRKRKLKEADRIEKTSGESQTVKYADIIDNCTEIVEQDTDFAGVFLFECRALLKRMTKGNKELYNKAVETVNHCIKRLKQKQRPAQRRG
jgi:guanosine-3',5'-bis(diphosphate) 3'-pyrophosphohydrolase